jgi:predicted O-linked N-acetylglucosamine transferase (SPINDLY family)
MRARLRAAFDQFIDVRGRSDREVAGLLRSLGIDIAIDLMGYTQGNRAGVFAERGAPVQVNYLGYPGTMGMAGFDYILADPWVIPHGHEAAYSESVVRLPDMYQVNDRKRAIDARTPSREEAGLPAKGFVFCCFNNSFKIAPAMFALWMRLLGRVEGSVLWLLEDNAAASRNLRIEAQRHGIGSERIVFAPRRPPPEHLARHRLADLFIDTLPYNAHTTASDALWAGLPLLTCAGTTFAGRVAASLLCAAGLPELVTQDLDAYERTAFALATDPGRLAALRTKLAENRARAPLFDTDRFRRHIEQAYTTMIRRSRDGLSPEPFDVRPVA